MFEKISPEAAGIPSQKVIQYINLLEKRGFSTHSLLLMRGDKVFAEAYWKPFDKNFCHRMYSQTKSFVGIAIGLLIEDGKLSLDDKIVELFPERIPCEQPRQMCELTVRHLLTMTTAGQPELWFDADEADRVRLYFKKRDTYRTPGTLWEYDSPGSQVLSALVEKISGRSLLDFLRDRLFSHMGTFTTAQILKTPNGDSWGDSAMICTARDMASFGRLLMNGGRWNGEQLINEEYVREATSAIVDNRESAFAPAIRHGYGYQIWKIEQNGFAFIGMGEQLTLCLPEKELMLVITSDNQGNPLARETIINGFFDIIVASAGKELAENEAASAELDKLLNELELYSVKGMSDSPMREYISGKVYRCGQNALGIEKFSFVFDGSDGGEFRYTNAQGDKVLPFGVNKNVFGYFPQFGYSNEVGGQRSDGGFTYRDAVSLCWTQTDKIYMKVQIIDKYFGNFSAVFGFEGKNVACRFEKTAEDFLNEYSGDIVGFEE